MPVHMDNQSMKPSRYNILCEGKSADLHYNTASGAIIKFTESKRNDAKIMLENPNANGTFDEEIRDTLVANGFIVDSELDEIGPIQIRMNRGRYRTNNMIFSILPTKKCNCQCVYCFEKENTEEMTDEDLAEAIKFIKRQIEDFKPGEVTIVWFGGEPLLEYNKVLELNRQVVGVCRNNDARMESSMITNGYLLTEEKAMRLKECKLKGIQITLDGTEKMHDQRRVLKGGQGTFAVIKKAVETAQKHFDRVNIRLNIDRNNAEDMSRLLDEPWLYAKNTKIAFGMLENLSEGCLGNTNIDVMDKVEYFDVSSDLYAKYLSNNKHEKDKPEDLIKRLSVRETYCGATSLGHWILGPGNKVYKCLASVDSNDVCGTIKNGKLQTNNKLCGWVLDDPCSKMGCTECRYFPVCMGGCIKLRNNYSHPSQSGTCGYWKKLIDDTLENILKG